MNRKVAIVVSLAMALVFTLLIVNAANRNYESAAARVKVARVKEFIPAGETIAPDKVEAVDVPKSAAEGMATVEEAVNRPAKVSMVKGQYVYREALDPGAALRPGYVEIFVPVNLASSAMVLPGQHVNVYVVAKRQQEDAPALLLEKARVLHSVSSQGEAVGSSKQGVAGVIKGGGVPAAVGIEVPADRAPQVAQAAAQGAVYLARTTP